MIPNDNRDLELLWVRVELQTASFLIGALYHPPKFGYPIVELYDYTEATLEELLLQNPDASVILAGDFNQLNIDEVSARTGLLPLVKTPTRGEKILDMTMTSALHLLQVKVISSAVRTDHKAILATPDGEIRDRTKTSSTRTFRRRSPGQHAELLYHLRNFSSEQYEVTEPDVAWSEFYATIIEWMDTFYPLRTITITSRDPAYITPELKFLLRRRNRLMRQQKNGSGCCTDTEDWAGDNSFQQQRVAQAGHSIRD